MLPHSTQADADAVMLRSLLTGSRRGRVASARPDPRMRPPNWSENEVAPHSGEHELGAWDAPEAGQPPPALRPEL